MTPSATVLPAIKSAATLFGSQPFDHIQVDEYQLAAVMHLGRQLRHGKDIAIQQKITPIALQRALKPSLFLRRL